MPFFEQSAYAERTNIGQSTLDAVPSDFPRLPMLTCPVRGSITPSDVQGIELAHYVLAADAGRETAWFADAPITMELPWVESPEVTHGEIRRSIGPHHQGLHIGGSGTHGVNTMLNGTILRD